MADEQHTPRNQLWLETFYLKNAALVVSKYPDEFGSTVDAEALLNVRSTYREIDEQYVEVSLILRVQAVANGDEIYRIELVQAGVFTVTGFTDEERLRILGSACPDMLYPFARHAVADFVRKSGFSDLLLRPLDFDAMYMQNLRERAEQSAEATT